MKVVYCALELTENDKINEETVARISKVSRELVVVTNLSKCTSGNHKRFAMLADLYLWTCKYWYGIYHEKLTFVELKGVDSLPTLFSLQYAEKIKLAISAKKLSIFDAEGMDCLKQASWESTHHFKEERIEKISPYIPLLEKSYELLSCDNNPFK